MKKWKMKAEGICEAETFEEACDLFSIAIKYGKILTKGEEINYNSR